jgi:hypothetical protein
VTEATRVEPGSFRDRDSRVVVAGDAVYRVLSERGADDWRALADSPLLGELTEKGSLVGTEEMSRDTLDGAAGVLAEDTAAVLRHERVPFVSYPYEWTFGMLRDAALLQLDIELAALDAGLSLKDATPYNLQFRGAEPVFIDVGSFEKLREGEPWTGYRQFCMLFLYPLLLQAYKDIPFHPWLRGSIDGITPSEAARFFTFGDRVLRRGVLTHVALHARLERRYEQREGGEVKEELKKANFKTELVKANVQRMRKLISRLQWKAGDTAWTNYRQENTYSDADAERKAAFVREAAASRRPQLTWDMGANDGAYARIAAEHSDYVVAFDLDHATVEASYRALREEGNRKILPLVANLADPSPGLGWRGLERRPLEGRGTPDLALALALVHHVSVTANVPLAEFLDWLHGLGATMVIEFPKREDPMVRRLLSGKREGSNADYELETFERLLNERFTVERSEPLPSGTRVLYLAHP